MASKEDQALFRAAEQWLTKNPGKTLADWKKETKYTGPALKIRNRRGEPVRISFKGQSAAAQTRRAAKEKPKTEEEAKYLRETKLKAKAQSQSTEALYVSGGKPSIAEHDVRLASGGTSEYMSVSDPEFKVHKDNVEAAANRRFGENAIVDIDDVSGDVRIIPAKFHNKFEPTSNQPGIDVPMGSSIDEALNDFQTLTEQSLNELKPSGGTIRLNRAAFTGLAAAGVAALGPLGTAASAAEFQGRSKLASETQDMMDELQAGVAGVSLAADVASYVPPVAPISEAVSTAADVANIGIDIYRQDPERIQRFAKQQIQEKIVEPITRPIKTAQKLIEDPEEFFQNELKYIGGQIRLGRLPYTR
jgi:hypothetical protein